MEDLTGKITDLLGDPQIMDKLKGLSGLLGSSEANNNSSENEEACTKNDESEDEPFEFPAEMMGTLLKLAPLLSSLKKEDKHTKFLKALAPLLSEKRRKKLDSSAQILQIVKILPLLKNQGLF